MNSSYLSYTLPRFLAPIILVLLVACICASPAGAAPDEFVYGRPELYVTHDDVLTLSLPLSVDNEDALGDLLRDGASLELKIEVVAQRRRGLWFNAELSKQEFTSLLRHDPLSREFRMSPPASNQLAQDKNLRALLARTWKEMHLPIAPAALFEPGSDYIIKIEISLKHTALPPWLDRTLVFWTKEVVNSTSIELNYRVEDAAVSR